MATDLITHIALRLKTQLGTLNKYIVLPKKRILCSVFHHVIPLTLQNSSKSFL